MSYRRLRRLLLFSALAFLAACQRQARSGDERIAILRFENLGSNPADDWMGRAFSEVIAAELQNLHGLYAIPAGRIHAVDAGFGPRPVAAPGISAERAAALAAGATRIAYGQYAVRNGTLEARLTIEDLRTGKIASLDTVTAPVADLVTAASALAKQISPTVTAYSTRNPQVLQAHVEALENLDAPAVADDLQKAIAADPNFGPPYRQLAQLKVKQRDRDGALALLDGALARGNSIDGAERARIQLEAAALRNDSAARLQALAALAKADPNDPQTWHDLAVTAMATHQYAQAEEAYRKSVGIRPDDPQEWNQLGYAAAYAGDTATATSALMNYQKLQPSNSNPLDSLGDINLIAGRLPEAESYYKQAAKLNPAFFAGLDFMKAAMARLMTGDIAGADTLAGQYLEGRAAAKDPWLDYRKAQWQWISGRRKDAARQLEKVAADSAATSREIASRAYAELAVWDGMLGNREAAAQMAQKGISLATPSSATEAILARFWSQPAASPAEWEARAAKLAPTPAQAPVRDVALAYALLLDKQFAAALPVLQRIYNSGNPNADSGLPILLAWANLETGHVPEAGTLLRFNPALADSGLSWSTPFHFPRIFYLRGVVAQKQGNAEQARQNFKLFEQLSGADALQWGEEQKAR